MVHAKNLFKQNTLHRMAQIFKFYDIGANLSDNMYNGYYHEKKLHESDIDLVLKKAQKCNVDKIISTSGNIEDINNNILLSKKYQNFIFTTAGCHPTRCLEFDQSQDDGYNYFNKLSNIIHENLEYVKAIGEYGLDYDRFHFCPKETQIKYFQLQMDLARRYGLPSFLHCRNSHQDFMEILKQNKDVIDNYGGVVHSFTGTLEESVELLAFSPKLFIGINGCSLKTEENLKTVSNIPLDRLMIETDAPWCEIKPSHASFPYFKTKFASIKKEKYHLNLGTNNDILHSTKTGDVDEKIILVKGRNEPCTLIQIIEVIYALKRKNGTLPAEMTIDIMANQIYENTCKFFKTCE